MFRHDWSLGDVITRHRRIDFKSLSQLYGFQHASISKKVIFCSVAAWLGDVIGTFLDLMVLIDIAIFQF